MNIEELITEPIKKSNVYTAQFYDFEDHVLAVFSHYGHKLTEEQENKIKRAYKHIKQDDKLASNDSK